MREHPASRAPAPAASKTCASQASALTFGADPAARQYDVHGDLKTSIALAWYTDQMTVTMLQVLATTPSR
ncbi:hypothetical protein [Paenibacillus thiaminolyticus]|nr:hypothetical protein [Paenibacillus thiaminolyticus]